VAPLGLAGAGGGASAAEVFAGAFGHGVHIGLASGWERAADAGAEVGVRSDPLNTLGWLGEPRAYGLISANLTSRTDFAAAGLLWRRDLGRRFYGQLGPGLAVHDGAVSPQDADHGSKHIALGSRVLFEPELGLGVRLTPRWSAELNWVHVSNAGLTKHNPGMDDLGARAVYRFGGR
jgi:hypothetical protein